MPRIKKDALGVLEAESITGLEKGDGFGFVRIGFDRAA